ncbi:protein CutA-like protein [Huso huso]|uniref:Protein CutA-like protein n=1 Tax=Huso huso TaxID=61971 RepID=A0ABR0YEP7_HUSHU
MDWFYQRFHKDSLSLTIPRPGCVSIFLAMLLSLVVYPVLKTVSLQLHSAFTGSYVSGFNSVALISCPNEQVAKDIARAVMEKRLAAGVNILPKSSSMYYWKGEIEEATEIPLLIKTRTSNIPKLSEYVRSIHPFEVPEIISFPIDQGNPLFMKWIEEAVPDE